MKSLSAIPRFIWYVLDIVFALALFIFIILPMMLFEYLTTSKEDKKFRKDFDARQKELAESEYRISFLPAKEMNCGPFSDIEKIKGRDNAENQRLFWLGYEEDDETSTFENKKFLWGNNEEHEIIIDSVRIAKIQKKQ